MQGTCGWLAAAVVLWALPAVVAAAVPEVAHFRVLGVREGLPSSSVMGLARDHAGFVWVATPDGLARYDGVSTTVWRHEAGNTASLSNDVVNAVHVDASDRVWAATSAGGVDVLEDGRVRHLVIARPHAPGEVEVSALASRGREVWIGTLRDGVVRLDAQGRMERFGPDEGDAKLASDCVTALEVDAAGGLWLGTRDGLVRWDGQRFRAIPLPGAEPDAIVYSVRWLDGALWVGSDTGVYRLNGQGWSTPDWSAMYARGNVVLDFASDGRSRLWIGSQRALWHVEPGQAPHPLAGTPGADRPAPVPQLLRDADGALWVPLARQGLGYLRADWRHVAEYTPAQGLRSEAYVATARSRDGGTWLLGEGGRLDYLDADGSVRAAPAPLDQALRGHQPTSLLEAPDGSLWLGEWDALLHVSADGTVRRWHLDDALDPALGGPNAMLAGASDGTLWVASNNNGLQQRDMASGRLLRDLRPPLSSEAMVFSTLATEVDGTPWMAVNGPLLAWDPVATHLRAAPVDDGEPPTALAFDGPSVLWLHRPGALERYRREGAGWRRVSRITSAEGLTEAGSNAMAIDPAHRVWVATARGLFRFDPMTGRLRRFGLDDGLHSQEFTGNHLTIGTDGVLVAPMENGGVLRLDTRADAGVSLAGRLRIDRVDSRHEGVWQPLDRTRPVLAQGDRELRVQLRMPAYANPQSLRFYTRLAGYDRGWVAGSGADPGERVFAGLPPGRYVLEARAMQLDSGRQVSTRLQFSVQPPWWRTLPAMVAFAFVLVAVAALLARALHLRRERRERLRSAERERALAQEASEAKTRFLSTLGHEVRTPMTGVLGMTELLLDTRLDAQQRHFVEAIRGAGEHLLEFVNDALDLARIEAGRLDIEDSSFDLDALLRDVQRWVQPLAARRGLGFDLQLDSRMPRRLRGDPVRLRQILLNLLGNALKFTSAGRLWLHVAARGERLCLVVGDTGPGMDEAQCRRLFERFEQAEGARAAAAYGSSGLGLAICRELATAMGGTLDVDSIEGIGTRFWLRLPLRVDAAPDATTDIAGAATRPEPARRVLLVEDDATVAEVLIGLLEAQGHSVTHTVHGLAALAAIATQRFELALLDLDLPGLDGCGLARQLRMLGFDMPLIAVTARSDSEARAQAQAAGFDRFVRKPVSGEQLRELIAGLRTPLAPV